MLDFLSPWGKKKKKKEQGHGYLNQVIITLVKCNAEKPVAVLLYLEKKIKIKEEELFQLQVRNFP